MELYYFISTIFMWCCKFIFKDIICQMRSWFPLYKGEQGSYRYIKPRTTIRLCSIQFRNVCYRLRLILVLHYTIVSFWCHPICRPNKVTERKMMNLFPSNSVIDITSRRPFSFHDAKTISYVLFCDNCTALKVSYIRILPLSQSVHLLFEHNESPYNRK